MAFNWDTIRISGGGDSIITKAAKKMLQNEAVITQWAPALLLMETERNITGWPVAANCSHHIGKLPDVESQGFWV
ncbi:MAG: hypothetical protein LBT23_03865 [Synergistaceae bacterium]|nr:hypothetical protein [Synergistaceae bacterium]